MKKTLFILLSIFCFIGITNAKDYEDLKLKWSEELPYLVNYFEEVDNYFIFKSNNSLYQYNKDGSIKTTLKGIKGNLNNIVKIDDKYLVITYENTSGEYTHYLYMLNEKYEVIHEDSIFTGPILLKKIYQYEEKIYLSDDERIVIEIAKDYNFVKPYEDENGNYIINSKRTLAFINKNNEVVEYLTGDYVTKIDDNYYTINYVNNSGTYKYSLVKYNSDFESILTNSFNTSYQVYNYATIDGVVYAYTTGPAYVKLTDTLTFEEVIEPTFPEYTSLDFENEYGEYLNPLYEEIYLLMQNTAEDNDHINVFDIYIDKDNTSVVTGIYETYAYNSNNYIFLQYYNEKKELVFNKKIYETGPGEYDQLGICSDNLVTATKKGDNIYLLYDKLDDINNIYLEIYDLEGNLLDTKTYNFEYNINPIKIRATNNGIIFFANTKRIFCVDNIVGEQIIPSYLSIQNTPKYTAGAIDITQVYYYEFPFEVKTKSDGNGTITATKVEALSGEVIEYEVKPKEGYVLGEVKVIDEYGNVITFTNNKFTMPSANVTIEATFVVENVDTADIAICTILILGLIGVFFIVSNKTKINYINN